MLIKNVNIIDISRNINGIWKIFPIIKMGGAQLKFMEISQHNIHRLSLEKFVISGYGNEPECCDEGNTEACEFIGVFSI